MFPSALRLVIHFKIAKVTVFLQEWDPDYNHFAYTLVSVLIQFLLPSILVIFLYARVCLAISSSHPNRCFTTISKARKIARKKRTNLMLILVSSFFFISWAPISIFNLTLHLIDPLKVCHIFKKKFKTIMDIDEEI